MDCCEETLDDDPHAPRCAWCGQLLIMCPHCGCNPDECFCYPDSGDDEDEL